MEVVRFTEEELEKIIRHDTPENSVEPMLAGAITDAKNGDLYAFFDGDEHPILWSVAGYNKEARVQSFKEAIEYLHEGVSVEQAKEKGWCMKKVELA